MKLDRVKDYFDALAPEWDRHCVHSPAVIREILDRGEVCAGKQVLDVACGTGILFDACLQRGIASLTAVDLSREMLRYARKSHPRAPLRLICGDAQVLDFGQQFDCILVYNALPHFGDFSGLVAHLCKFLRPGGRLTIAHGSSRADINACHAGSAREVSVELIPAEELARSMQRFLTVDTVISDTEKYIVSGFSASEVKTES